MITKGWFKEGLGEDIFNAKYRNNNETFSEWIERVAGGNKEAETAIIDKRLIPAGRILSNRGLHKFGKKVTYSNCYVLNKVEDSIEGIFETAKEMARTFSYGGGVGIDITNLRPKKSSVNNSAEETSGSVSFMDLYSLTTGLIGQNGRRGALMVSMKINHPDIEEFIKIKTDLDRVTKANISIRMTNEFMEKVKNDEDFTAEFKVYSSGEVITKTWRARELYKMIMEVNWDYAEPGILFWDRINDWNIMSEDSEFEFAGVNPCAEEPLPAGGSCLLTSVNLSEMVKDGEFDFELFRKTVRTGVTYLNEVLEEGLPLHPLKIQRESVGRYRQIGLGILGLGNMLIKLKLKYSSEEGREMVDKVMAFMANEALLKSSELTKEYGTFEAYKKQAVINSPFVKANATKETIEHIEMYGLCNSQILTVAPTGSTATFIGESTGCEPNFLFNYWRKTESLYAEDKHYEVAEPIVGIMGYQKGDELPDYFETANSIDVEARVKMQGVIQKHVDAAISSTVNLPNSATVEDVENVYMLAYENGLKGITVYRDGCKRSGILTSSTQEEEQEFIPFVHCPDCYDNDGTLVEMIEEGGCKTCRVCGFSPCS